MEEEIKLTQYSRGAGCGCKIAPTVLQEILKTDVAELHIPNLIIGNGNAEDAAVYDMGNGNLLIATTDFFMPIVDDAYTFGRIAAANAISDVYAMGGKPALALAILGWPVDKLPAALAQKVLEGARSICAEAGIPLAGGHSVDTTEPLFGLCVNGFCNRNELKRNNTANEGDLLLLTKAIGTGVLATALKRDLIQPHHREMLSNQLTTLNSIGTQLAAIPGITAMTDVTGFGIAGHLIEMAEGSDLSADLYYDKVQILDGVKEYLAARVVPDATYRNWNAYSSKIAFDEGVDVMEAFSLLPDPQTNGGLLFSVSPDSLETVTDILSKNGYGRFVKPIGIMTKKGAKSITVKK